MHIVQIKQPTETWIVAISQHKEDTTEYLATLSVEIQAAAFLYEIPFEYYPFIIIENVQLSHDSDSYFEYCDVETLQTRIETAREHKVDSDNHIYFKYYFIDTDYFQIANNENWMIYLNHTSVMNNILAQPYAITVFHENIKKHVFEYDTKGLDLLLEQTKSIYNSKLEKEDLAINGYENLFWRMYNDFTSRQLTETVIEYLLPMVENTELLLGQKKPKHRSLTLYIILEMACQNKSENIFLVLKETLESFENYLVSHPEEKLKIHRLVSIAYRWMIAADRKNALLYWQNAVLEIKKAIDYDPEKASWLSFFELIYTPFEEDEKIHQEQIQEQKKFTADILNLEKERGTIITYQIALAYENLQEHLEWKEIKNVFPENLTLQWAEKALAYQPKEISKIDLYECAEFFNKVGSKNRRIDFLEKTISLYERVLNARTDCELEVYYIANLWKQIAEIHLENKQNALADESIMQAISLYNKYPSTISTNFRYAEFLEYCYSYEGNIKKPTIAELKHIGEEIEIQSEGYHSYPYILLMRIALFENDEQQAILECTKSLILHELCAQETFKSLSEEFKQSDFNNVKSFLNETIVFMNEAEDNYYYDPQLKWEKIRVLPNEELLTYWEKRKEEIINRTPENENN